eukprot:8812306-Lingulodinium_polyedra.AAC.1
MCIRDSPVDAGITTKGRKRRDHEWGKSLLSKHGQKAPGVIHAVGAKHGLKGRWVEHAMRKGLIQYFLACRTWFGRCRVLCVSVDCGRI